MDTIMLTPIISGFGFIKDKPYVVIKADTASALLIATENNPEGLWVPRNIVKHVFGVHIYERVSELGFMVLHATNPEYFTNETFTPKAFAHLSIWDSPDLSEKYFGVAYNHAIFINQMMQHPRLEALHEEAVQHYKDRIFNAMAVPNELLGSQERKTIDEIGRFDDPSTDVIGIISKLNANERRG